jgi:subtilisin family serine protease
MPRYLVEVKPGKEEQVKRALKALGIRIVGQVLNYISIEIPAEMVPKVEAVPGVVRVVEERTYRVQAFVAPPIPFAVPAEQVEIPVEQKLDMFMRLGGPANPLAMMWSYAQGIRKDRWPTSESRRVLGADIADQMGISGKRVKVAVLDTGFDWSPQLLMVDHMESVLPGQLPVDENGHGTHCITTIKGARHRSPWGVNEGVAKGVTMASIKCLGYGIGTASTSDVMRAVVRAAEWGAKVVSMSLGGDVKPGERHDPNECPLCSLIARLARERKMLFAIAAGNSGRGYASCPGLSPEAITVAALRKDLTVASFSSREHPDYIALRKPDVGAPGVYTGAATTGLIAAMEWYDGFKTAFISGTSMATPHIAGLLALWVEYARRKGVELTRDVVMDIIRTYAKQWRPDVGYGVPRFEWIVDYLR